MNKKLLKTLGIAVGLVAATCVVCKYISKKEDEYYGEDYDLDDDDTIDVDDLDEDNDECTENKCDACEKEEKKCKNNCDGDCDKCIQNCVYNDVDTESNECDNNSELNKLEYVANELHSTLRESNIGLTKNIKKALVETIKSLADLLGDRIVKEDA